MSYVVLVGYHFHLAAKNVPAQFPEVVTSDPANQPKKVNFVVLDSLDFEDASMGQNVHVIQFSTEETGYMAGVVSGTLVLSSTVKSAGLLLPSGGSGSKRFGNAFRIGMQDACPDCSILKFEKPLDSTDTPLETVQSFLQDGSPLFQVFFDATEFGSFKIIDWDSDISSVSSILARQHNVSVVGTDVQTRLNTSNQAAPYYPTSITKNHVGALSQFFGAVNRESKTVIGFSERSLLVRSNFNFAIPELVNLFGQILFIIEPNPNGGCPLTAEKTKIQRIQDFENELKANTGVLPSLNPETGNLVLGTGNEIISYIFPRLE